MANIIAMDKGLLNIEDVADDYVHCVQCGGCEIRCPNTLFVGDFYQARTETVKVVRAARALMVDKGLDRDGWKLWNRLTKELTNEPVLGTTDEGQPQGQPYVRAWAEGLDIPVGGETIMFVDCEAAFYRTSNTRATAQVLQKAGVEFGLMNEQWCCGGPAAEMGYVEQSRAFAEHNVSDWRASGVKRIIAIEPHDYIHFTEDYPAYFGADFDFEVVQIVELVADLIKHGKLKLDKPINKTVTYHDPCRLNKRKNIHEAPRFILNSIPGLTFKDVDHVTQWSYCSGGGGGLPIEKPEITAGDLATPGWRAHRNSASTCSSARACGRSGRWRPPATRSASRWPTSSSWSPSRQASRSAARRGASDLEVTPMTTATVRTLDEAVVADLEAIMNEPGSVLTNISSRANRTRVPAPFPVHRWGDFIPAAVVSAAHRRAGVGDREAGQPRRACRWCPAPAAPA